LQPESGKITRARGAQVPYAILYINYLLIGVSENSRRSSVTALCTCLSMVPCLLGPVIFNWAHSKLNIYSHMHST